MLLKKFVNHAFQERRNYLQDWLRYMTVYPMIHKLYSPQERTSYTPHSHRWEGGWKGSPSSAAASSTSPHAGLNVSSPENYHSYQHNIILVVLTLAVSLPLIYWNSLGVSQDPWNHTQGPLLPWHRRDRNLGIKLY